MRKLVAIIRVAHVPANRMRQRYVASVPRPKTGREACRCASEGPDLLWACAPRMNRPNFGPASAADRHYMRPLHAPPGPYEPGSSGLVQLPIDRPEDEPGGLGALATELLALVLFERHHQVGEVLVHRGRPNEVARRERRVQPRDDG